MTDRRASIEKVRRRDRGKDDDWIREFLARASFGFLATVADGRAFLNSNLFAYDAEGHRIYVHTARTGRTPENVARGGPGTFSAAAMGRLLPAAEALEFSVEYAAVVAFGELHPVVDAAEKRRALERVMEKYAPHLEPGRDYRPITDAELARTAVHRLDITAWSGKEKAAEPGFPGAYSLPAIRPPVRIARDAEETLACATGAPEGAATPGRHGGEP